MAVQKLGQATSHKALAYALPSLGFTVLGNTHVTIEATNNDMLHQAARALSSLTP